MHVSTKLEPDFSRGCAHPAAQPPISAIHPQPRNSRIASATRTFLTGFVPAPSQVTRVALRPENLISTLVWGGNVEHV